MAFTRLVLPFILIPAILSCGFFLMFSFMTVKGDSMSPLINEGQHILYARFFYGLRTDKYWVRWNKVRNGDLVVFRQTGNDRLLIKRCIGVSGDRIYCSDNKIQIAAGHTLELSSGMCDYFSDYAVVPENYLFVAGDNADNSIDSRTFGFVHRDDVRGKVVYISGIQDRYGN